LGEYYYFELKVTLHSISNHGQTSLLIVSSLVQNTSTIVLIVQAKICHINSKLLKLYLWRSQNPSVYLILFHKLLNLFFSIVLSGRQNILQTQM